jgi:hypothetical protein
MYSPFQFPEAMIYLRELNGSDDAVVVLKRAVIAFDDSYDVAEEKHIPVPAHTCINYWVSCCLIDAIVNDTDYTEEGGAEYAKAFKKLKTAFGKKRFLSTKPVNDIHPTLQNAYENLFMFTIEEDVELVRKVREAGEFEDFCDAIVALSERLEPHVTK